ALDILLDAADFLPRVFGQNLVGNHPQAQNLAGVDVNIGRLAAQPAHRGLVDEDPRGGQGEALALGPGRQQGGRHAGRLADAYGGDIGADELHGVVDGQTGGDRATGAVDVERNILFRVFGLEE